MPEENINSGIVEPDEVASAEPTEDINLPSLILDSLRETMKSKRNPVFTCRMASFSEKFKVEVSEASLAIKDLQADGVLRFVPIKTMPGFIKVTMIEG